MSAGSLAIIYEALTVIMSQFKLMWHLVNGKSIYTVFIFREASLCFYQ